MNSTWRTSLGNWAPRPPPAPGLFLAAAGRTRFATKPWPRPFCNKHGVPRTSTPVPPSGFARVTRAAVPGRLPSAGPIRCTRLTVDCRRKSFRPLCLKTAGEIWLDRWYPQTVPQHAPSRGMRQRPRQHHRHDLPRHRARLFQCALEPIGGWTHQSEADSKRLVHYCLPRKFASGFC